MAIELPTITIAELHKQLQAYIDQGLGGVPVVATDCRGYYPFQAYTVLNQSGYTDALLLYVRPDAYDRAAGLGSGYTAVQALAWYLESEVT